MKSGAPERTAASAKTEHFPPRARNVIFLYMDGGPSQVDTFDYKPLLAKYHGRDPRSVFPVEPTQFNNVGKVMATPWKFRRQGESGLSVSALFPHVAECVDDSTLIHSLVSKFPEHTSANYFLHTGSGLQGRPSMGVWVNYGLGSANKNLLASWSSTAASSHPGDWTTSTAVFCRLLIGSLFGRKTHPCQHPPPGTERPTPAPTSSICWVSWMPRRWVSSAPAMRLNPPSPTTKPAIGCKRRSPSCSTARGESAATRSLYGLDAPYEPTRIFAAEFLIARRLVERGVRFLELTCPSVGTDRWDQHSNLKDGHEKNCRAVDQPIAGLLQDLKARGLLQTTLVLWAGEFGRTPFAQESDGRDHNPFGFTIWMAGGGVKSGFRYGATDEWGYKVVQDRVEIHDLHATLLYLLGVDHKRLTFRFGGRDIRLTDVHGEIVRDILA